MDVHALLDDALSRVPEEVRPRVEDLQPDDLRWRPAPEANPIGWLVWHLTRVQDAQIAQFADVEPLWSRDGWVDRFVVPEAPTSHGYGWTREQVDALGIPDAEVLLDHLDAVSARCRGLVGGLSVEDLDRVIDERWDPPVTVGVRLVSVIDDAAQHTGQVGYVRGMLDATR